MRRLTVALLSGGTSSERKVSLKGGDQVYAAIDKKKYKIIRYDPKTDLARLVNDAPQIDTALIILHGSPGEDGTIQGLLDLLNIPYQGSGVIGSAIAINKLVSKQLYEKNGLPVPPYIVIKDGDPINPDACINRIGVPLVVKPVMGGSSIGTSIVTSKDSFKNAVNSAFGHDDSVLIETYIKGIELTVSVLGNNKLEALPIVEIYPDKKYDFFDFDAKYTAGATKEVCPARIDNATTDKVKTYAKMAHCALACKGYSRTDMILRNKEIFILETNTIPGMATTSLLPLAAKAAGISFSRLIDMLIDLSIEEHRK